MVEEPLPAHDVPYEVEVSHGELTVTRHVQGVCSKCPVPRPAVLVGITVDVNEGVVGRGYYGPVHVHVVLHGYEAHVVEPTLVVGGPAPFGEPAPPELEHRDEGALGLCRAYLLEQPPHFLQVPGSYHDVV